MRLDAANRSFLALVAVAALAGYIVLGAAVCVLLALVVYRVAADGPDALAAGSDDVSAALVFIAVVGAGMLLGAASLVRQLRASRRLTARVRDCTLPAPARLASVTRRLAIGTRVTLVDSPEAFSFVYGALTPRIVISRGLLDVVDDDELDAVLEHERYHVRNLDPLKVLTARTLTSAFYYLPILAALRGRYIAGRELAADRRAVRRCSQRSLAGALFKVVQAPGWPLGPAAAIGGPELLDVRVSQLELGREPPLDRPSPRYLLLSALGATVLTAAFVLSVTSFGGLDAVIRATMPGMGGFSALDTLGMIACALPLVLGGAGAWHLLGRRASRLA